MPIRPFRATDLPQILAIENASFPHPYEEELFSLLWRSSPNGFLVAHEDNRIVAYALYGVQGGKGTIYSLAVRPDARRRGYGDSLLDHALQDLSQKVRRVRLQVAVDNRPALELYEKHGFTKKKILRRYYEDGQDAYVMTKELSRPP
jgi:ribosomal-protein-alanine N-acetyltransferase